MTSTQNCVRCGKPAKIFGGQHVLGPKTTLKARKKIIAGWCRRCDTADTRGFVGHWAKWMGMDRT